jgi:hypothetical protein
MTSGPTGLKIDWFEPSPGFDRLAPASQGRESKMLFHQRNKKVVAAMTQNRPLHDHFPSPSASAFVIDRAPACCESDRPIPLSGSASNRDGAKSGALQ